jgi:hypothetical protein
MTHKLVCEEQDSLETEFAVAKVEEVLKGGAKEVHDHRVVIAFGAEPPDKGHTDAACEGLVDLGLVLKLGMLGLDGLELDGDLFTGNDVDSEINVT